MSLTAKQLEIEVAETYKDLKVKDWKAKSDYRGITHRSQKDFDSLIPMYVRKICNIREQLKGDWSTTIIPSREDGKLKTAQELGDELVEQLQYFITKEERLVDKFAACLKEVEMRKNGDVVRTNLHHQAVYYIDYGQADDTGDGLTTGNAYKTINKYTTTEIRTAGDIAYLRANVTWAQGTEAVDITFDEDGTIASYIKIIGCDSVTNDPWSDGSDVLPIIDFEDAAFQFKPNGDDYWYLERLDVIQSNDSAGNLYALACIGLYFKSCVFRDTTAAGREGITLSQSGATVDSCTFIDNYSDSLSISGGVTTVKSCTFNGGAGASKTDRGIQIQYGTLYVYDTTFGATTTHDTTDIYCRNSGRVYARNCVWNTTPVVATGGLIFSEDDDGVAGVHKVFVEGGAIGKETAAPRSGGAASYAEVVFPVAEIGPNKPARLSYNPLLGDFPIYLAAGTYTLTVYMRRSADWTIEPTAAQLYINASYLDTAPARSISTNSTETLPTGAYDANVWTAFTTTFTSTDDGWVYVSVYLTKQELSAFVDVDLMVNDGTNDFEYMFVQAIPAVKNVVAGGGGGLLTHPGMSGGMRG